MQGCEDRGDAMDPGMEMCSILSVCGSLGSMAGDVPPRLGAVPLSRETRPSCCRLEACGIARRQPRLVAVEEELHNLAILPRSPEQIPRVVR